MEKIFYLGEIVLLREYRGQGVGATLYEMFEQFVKKNTQYAHIALCEVIPKKNDPRQATGYFCLDKFWSKRGFVKQPELIAQFSWKEVGSNHESSHPMVFWMKTLQ